MTKPFLTLPDRIAVYIPSTTDTDQYTDTTEYVNAALRFLSTLCGGATSQQARGAWVSESGVLVIEDVTIVYSNTDDLNDSLVSQVYDFAGHIKQALSQEAVSVEINGALNLV